MKTLVLSLLFCIGVQAQVMAIVSSQGVNAIALATGYNPKNAVLERVDVCNLGAADVTISSTRIVASIISSESYPVFSSQVVNSVLFALQQKDVFTRAQKALSAAANTGVLLTAVFKKWSPMTALLVDSAPAIASAILPAIGSPRDLMSISQQLIQDNQIYVLGKIGGGNDCHTGLVVAMTKEVKIDKVVIQ